MTSPRATPLRFVDRAHVLMSDGWVVRAASLPLSVHALTPNCRARCPRRSVQHNELDDDAKGLLREAAGTRIKLRL